MVQRIGRVPRDVPSERLRRHHPAPMQRRPGTQHPEERFVAEHTAHRMQYQPATLDGKPVKYLKRLTISVASAPQQP